MNEPTDAPPAALSHDSVTPDDAPATKDTAQTLGGLRLASCIVALPMSISIVSLDMTILATAIPRISQEFNNLDDIGWHLLNFTQTSPQDLRNGTKRQRARDLLRSRLSPAV
ncbi:hypothetical protein E8E14_004398 [Neopestalotiopsis sp. 37M]|nr:hypothetical protein E8E14_004398 [Neopestalotiopsis sp. 37M]